MSSRVVKVWRIDDGAFPKHVFQTEDGLLFHIWHSTASGATYIRQISNAKFSRMRHVTEI